MSLWRETSARRSPTRMRHGMACGISPSFVVAQKGNQSCLRTHKKGTFHKQRQKTRKECRPSLLGGDGCVGKQVGRMARAEFSGDGGGDTFAAEGRVREVKGRRTGRDFRSRGGRIVFFFADLARGNRQSGRDWGLSWSGRGL